MPNNWRVAAASEDIGFHSATGALDGLGVDIVTVLRVLMTFGTYVVGAALREIQEIRWQDSVAESTAGMTEGEIDERFEFGVDCMLDGIAARLGL